MAPTPYSKMPSQEETATFPRPRKSSNASIYSEGSPASLRRQRQNMTSFDGSSSNLSLPLLFIKEKLQWTVFSGEYKERRYMDFLKSYRDVLVIDKVEKEAAKVFKEVIKHCKKEMDENVWIGIKKSEEGGILLYVELPEGQPFGHYWFLVRSVKYRPSHGLDLRIRCLRKVCAGDGGGGAAPSAAAQRPWSQCSRQDVVDWAAARLSALPWTDAAQTLRQVFSGGTVRELGRALAVLAALLVTLAREAPGWTLRLVDAAGIFVQRCTPLATAVLQFCLKVVGGLYILLARVWSDLRRPAPVAPYRALAPPPLPPPQVRYQPVPSPPPPPMR